MVVMCIPAAAIQIAIAPFEPGSSCWNAKPADGVIAFCMRDRSQTVGSAFLRPPKVVYTSAGGEASSSPPSAPSADPGR